MKDLYILKGNDTYYISRIRKFIQRSICIQDQESNMNPLTIVERVDGSLGRVAGCVPRRGIKLKRKLSGY